MKKLNYNPFNSPWECRIGLTKLYQVNKEIEALIVFQFPVGMSNRSYPGNHEDRLEKYIVFQFPVGMSNRSYLLSGIITFKSMRGLSIPRGNVE